MEGTAKIGLSNDGPSPYIDLVDSMFLNQGEAARERVRVQRVLAHFGGSEAAGSRRARKSKPPRKPPRRRCRRAMSSRRYFLYHLRMRFIRRVVSSVPPVAAARPLTPTTHAARLQAARCETRDACVMLSSSSAEGVAGAGRRTRPIPDGLACCTRSRCPP